MSLLCKKLIISGKVQGVGYRSWLKTLCIKNKISGSVSNKENGDVEAFFYDISEEMFKIILSNCFLGPSKAKVTNIFVERLSDKKNLSTFEIVK